MEEDYYTLNSMINYTTAVSEVWMGSGKLQKEEELMDRAKKERSR